MYHDHELPTTSSVDAQFDNQRHRNVCSHATTDCVVGCHTSSLMESKKLLLDAEAQQGPAHGWRVLVKDEGLAVFTNKVHTVIKTSP